MRNFLPFLQEKQRGLLSGLHRDWSPIGTPVVVLFSGACACVGREGAAIPAG